MDPVTKTMKNEETKWLVGYVLSSWLSNFGHGMVVTVIGPSQPYLAYNVGVPIGQEHILKSKLCNMFHKNIHYILKDSRNRSLIWRRFFTLR